MKDEIKEILNKLEFVAMKHTIEICEDGSKRETIPASVVDELRLNNYSARILLDYITNLQEENEKLKSYIKLTDEEAKEYMYDTNKEIERLNNIINEFEKWLEERRTYYCTGCSNIYEDSLGKTRLVNEDIFDEITKIKDKLKELKEGK